MSDCKISDFISDDFQSSLFSSAWKTSVYEAGENTMKECTDSHASNPLTSGKCITVQRKICFVWLKNSHQSSGHLGCTHKLKHIARIFAHCSGTCGICLKGFRDRVRLIHHLRQSSYSCLMQYEVHNLTLTRDQTDEFDLEDRLATAAAKRSGLSKLHAASPAVQFSGPKRPLINSCLTSMHDERFINAVS